MNSPKIHFARSLQLCIFLTMLFGFSCSSSDEPIPDDGVSIFDGSVILSSQEELENFVNDYTIVTGNIDLKDGITSLSPLSSLKTVEGNLRVFSNPNLTEISGLSSLESVGLLFISNNPSLSSISLNNLKLAEGISIGGNEQLEFLSMIGLESVGTLSILDFLGSTINLSSLIEIQEGLFLQNMPNMSNMSSFNVIESVGQSLSISDFPALSSITGFENLESIGGSLEVFHIRNQNNTNVLQDVNLPKLASIGGDLYFLNCNVLSLLMSNLIEIGGKLHYANTGELEEMKFDNLESLGALDITWGDSPSTLSFPKLKKIELGSNAEGESTLKLGGLDVSSISFSSLVRINGNLEFTDNQSLVNLSDFESLQMVTGDIIINNNSALESINGFEVLNSTSTISVTSNSSLGEFCGLLNVIQNGSYSGLEVEFNYKNPTEEDLSNGICSL